MERDKQNLYYSAIGEGKPWVLACHAKAYLTADFPRMFQANVVEK